MKTVMDRLFGGYAQLLVGILLSLLFLVLAIHGVDVTAVLAAIQRTDILLLAVATITVLLTNLAKAIRWRLLFYPDHQQRRLGTSFAVLTIGQTLNAFAPLRVGDIARAYLLNQHEGAGVGLSLYTIGLEKALDSMMVLAFLAAVSLVMAVPPWLKQSSIILSIALAVALIAILIGGRHVHRFQDQAGWLERHIALLARLHLREKIIHAGSVLDALAHVPIMFTLLVWSLGIWGLAATTNWILFRAMHVNMGGGAEPIIAAVFSLVVLQLGAVLPSSPGRVGVFHYLAVLSLDPFGVEKGLALSYGIVLHAIVYIPTSVMGAYYLWRLSAGSIGMPSLRPQ
jgi:uncharacterized protein (TIRG00374 family)